MGLSLRKIGKRPVVSVEAMAGEMGIRLKKILEPR